MSTGPLNNRAEPRVNRTCEGCRKRKIKCVRDIEGPSVKCERCTKLNLDCVFSAPAIRKKRKRNEAQIRELQEKLDRVWRLVSSEQRHSHSSDSGSGSVLDPYSTESGTPRRFGDIFYHSCPSDRSSISATQAGPYILENLTSLDTDPVGHGLVEESLALELCERFCEEALPHYPFVFVPGPLSLQTFRQSRPALFRAILAAASTCFQPELSSALYQNADRYVSEQAIVHGQKSIDLAQGALVLAVWSRVPAQFKDLNFGQFANLAASLVTDLRSSNDKQYQIPRTGTTDESQLEVARTYAAIYLLCSSISMSYRRPTNLQYGPWVETCIQILASSSVSPAADRLLATWTQLQRIAEQGLRVAGLDDITDEHRDNSRISAVLGATSDQVRRWSQDVPSNTMSGALAIHYQVVLLNLCVPQLYLFHDSEAFRPPFTIRYPTSDPSAPDTPDHAALIQFMDARAKSLAIARDILDLFLAFSISDLQRIPVIVFTRVMFASVVIMKMNVCNSPNSGIAPIDMEDVIGDLDLLDTVVNRLAQASDNCRFEIPFTFYSTLQRMISWCQDAFLSLDGPSDTVMEPLRGLKSSYMAELTAAPPSETFGSRPLAYDYAIDTGPTQLMDSDFLMDPEVEGI